MNLQKSVAFLYANNEQTKKGYSKTNSIYNSLKKIKYPRMNLKYLNDLYKMNYKQLKKEIQEDYRRWIGRINIVKMAIYC
jgi:hypothetical protein